MKLSPVQKVIFVLIAVLVSAGLLLAFVGTFSPNSYAFLAAWQAGLGAFLGFAGLIVAAIYNFELNRRRDDRTRWFDLLNRAQALQWELAAMLPYLAPWIPENTRASEILGNINVPTSDQFNASNILTLLRARNLELLREHLSVAAEFGYDVVSAASATWSALAHLQTLELEANTSDPRRADMAERRGQFGASGCNGG